MTRAVTQPNRVWIELEKPRDAAHAEQICAQATAMLQRLSPGTPHRFEWAGDRYLYGSDMGSLVLIDSGHWFNLDHLGRPLEDERAQALRWRAALEELNHHIIYDPEGDLTYTEFDLMMARARDALKAAPATEVGDLERQALRSAAGAIDALLHELSQMRGMFDDADGTTAEAVEAGEAALAEIRAASAKSKGGTT